MYLLYNSSKENNVSDLIITNILILPFRDKSKVYYKTIEVISEAYNTGM